jgi:YidC/Oxa1 family membrane protein insertase
MEKRTLLAVVISLAILILYQKFVAPHFFPQPPLPTEKAASEPALPRQEKGEREAPAVAVQVSAEAEDEIGKVLAEQAKAEEKEISVETEFISVIISTHGGTVKSWQLKGVHESIKDKTPLQLVSPKSKESGYYPMSLHYDDSSLTQRVNNGIYLADRKEIMIEAGGEKQSLTLSYQDPDGLKVVKTFTFYPDNYLIDITLTQENVSGPVKNASYFLCWGYGLGNQEVSGYVDTGPTSYIDGDLITDAPDDIKGQLIHKGNISWTGIQDTYFAAMFIPSSVTSSASVFKTTEGLLTVGISSREGQLKPGEKGTDTYNFYAGPKQRKRLAMAQKNLENIVDYGWFSVIAEPLMGVLEFFHRYVKNWGIAIILLTVVIKLLFYPLTNASFKSMKGMQKIQPKVTAIREKYKKDPQRMNTEIMELYKKHKVNPLGGCLPMVLQIPVFFGLYKALLVSIELRHAPAFFFWWIQDLSSKDPFYITPIAMGATMFFQQKMTPSTGDPKQQKIMMLMPIVMTFLFLNFSSGLVIYWLINNILTVAQQFLINRQQTEE